jgi:hypothetical protein
MLVADVLVGEMMNLERDAGAAVMTAELNLLELLQASLPPPGGTEIVAVGDHRDGALLLSGY